MESREEQVKDDTAVGGPASGRRRLRCGEQHLSTPLTSKKSATIRHHDHHASITIATTCTQS